MICYKCHSEMDKKIKNDTIIDICPVCGGIWADKFEFERILFNYRNNKISNDLYKLKEFEKQNERLLQIVGLCPKCGKRKLVKFDVDGITLDKCLDCGGLYFDYKEFQKLINNKSSNIFSKFINYILFKLFKKSI